MLVVSSQPPPLGLALSEVSAIPQLLSSERIVGKDETIFSIGECVVVRIGEDYDIVRLALSKEVVVGSLIAQAH